MKTILFTHKSYLTTGNMEVSDKNSKTPYQEQTLKQEVVIVPQTPVKPKNHSVNSELNVSRVKRRLYDDDSSFSAKRKPNGTDSSPPRDSQTADKPLKMCEVVKLLSATVDTLTEFVKQNESLSAIEMENGEETVLETTSTSKTVSKKPNQTNLENCVAISSDEEYGSDIEIDPEEVEEISDNCSKKNTKSKSKQTGTNPINEREVQINIENKNAKEINSSSSTSGFKTGKSCSTINKDDGIYIEKFSDRERTSSTNKNKSKELNYLIDLDDDSSSEIDFIEPETQLEVIEVEETLFDEANIPLSQCIETVSSVATILLDDAIIFGFITKYQELDNKVKMLYDHILKINQEWIRASSIRFNFSELQNSIEELNKRGFIEKTNLDNKLEDILKCLTYGELKKLGKWQHISNCKKDELIKKLISNCKQSNNFFNVSTSLETKMKKKALHLIHFDNCFKLARGPEEIYRKIAVAANCPYYQMEKSHLLINLPEVLKNMKYLHVKICDKYPQQRFHTLDQFNKYYNSLQLKDKIEKAKDSQNNREAVALILNAKTELEIFLNSSSAEVKQENFRFTSGHCSACCLNFNIEFLKREKFYNELLVCLNVLLSQHHFLVYRRIDWAKEKENILKLKKSMVTI